jgi:hypothetical protein
LSLLCLPFAELSAPTPAIPYISFSLSPVRVCMRMNLAIDVPSWSTMRNKINLY